MTPAKQQEVLSLLERGGFSPPVRGSKGTGYDPLLDPEGVERLCELLSEAIVSRGPTTLIVWDGVGDAVLGFVLARRLSLPLARLVNEEGLLVIRGKLPSAARVVLVTEVVRAPMEVVAAEGAVRVNGGELLAIAALVDAGSDAHLPVDALIQITPSDDVAPMGPV